MMLIFTHIGISRTPPNKNKKNPHKLHLKTDWHQQPTKTVLLVAENGIACDCDIKGRTLGDGWKYSLSHRVLCKRQFVLLSREDLFLWLNSSHVKVEQKQFFTKAPEGNSSFYFFRQVRYMLLLDIRILKRSASRVFFCSAPFWK